MASHSVNLGNFRHHSEISRSLALRVEMSNNTYQWLCVAMHWGVFSIRGECGTVVVRAKNVWHHARSLLGDFPPITLG